MNTQYLDLDLNKQTGNQQIAIAQGDAAGTTIVATIYDSGTKLADTGITAYFCMELPDRKHYVRDEAAYESGVITYVVDESRAASVNGYTDNAYFELRKGSEIASTERFAVIVRPSAYDGLDAGETYDTEIVQLLNALDAAIDDADAATDRAAQATGNANLATQNASDAASAATKAASEAAAAAAAARSAVSGNVHMYFTYEEVGDGALMPTFVDETE